MDVAGVQFTIDATPAEAGARRATTALDQLEARIDRFAQKAMTVNKSLLDALSLNGLTAAAQAEFVRYESAFNTHRARLEQSARQSMSRLKEILDIAPIVQNAAGLESVTQSYQSATEAVRSLNAEVQQAQQTAQTPVSINVQSNGSGVISTASEILQGTAASLNIGRTIRQNAEDVKLGAERLNLIEAATRGAARAFQQLEQQVGKTLQQLSSGEIAESVQEIRQLDKVAEPVARSFDSRLDEIKKQLAAERRALKKITDSLGGNEAAITASIDAATRQSAIAALLAERKELQALKKDAAAANAVVEKVIATGKAAPTPGPVLTLPASDQLQKAEAELANLRDELLGVATAGVQAKESLSAVVAGPTSTEARLKTITTELKAERKALADLQKAVSKKDEPTTDESARLKAGLARVLQLVDERKELLDLQKQAKATQQVLDKVTAANLPKGEAVKIDLNKEAQLANLQADLAGLRDELFGSAKAAVAVEQPIIDIGTAAGTSTPKITEAAHAVRLLTTELKSAQQADLSDPFADIKRQMREAQAVPPPRFSATNAAPSLQGEANLAELEASLAKLRDELLNGVAAAATIEQPLANVGSVAADTAPKVIEAARGLRELSAELKNAQQAAKAADLNDPFADIKRQVRESQAQPLPKFGTKTTLPEDTIEKEAKATQEAASATGNLKQKFLELAGIATESGKKIVGSLSDMRSVSQALIAVLNALQSAVRVFQQFRTAAKILDSSADSARKLNAVLNALRAPLQSFGSATNAIEQINRAITRLVGDSQSAAAAMEQVTATFKAARDAATSAVAEMRRATATPSGTTATPAAGSSVVTPSPAAFDGEAILRDIRVWNAEAVRLAKEGAESYAKGFASGAGATEKAGETIGDAAEEGIRKELQQRSPSRVLLALGREAAQSFATGFDSGASRIRAIKARTLVEGDVSGNLRRIGAELRAAFAEIGTSGNASSAQLGQSLERVASIARTAFGGLSGKLRESFAENAKSLRFSTDGLAVFATQLSVVTLTLGALTVAALAAAPALAILGKVGLEENSRLEQTRIGIASVVASVGELRNSQGVKIEGIDELNAALPLAQKQLDALRVDALSTALEFKDISQGFLQAVGPGLEAGLSLDQIRKTVVDISQLIAPLTGDTSQLGQELRAILSGDINADTQVAKALGITREAIQAAKEQNRLADFLNEKLKVAAATGTLMGKSFTAAASNLKEAGTVLAGVVTEGLFDTLRERVNTLLPKVFETAGGKVSIASSFRGITDALRTVFDGIGQIVGGAITGVVSALQSISAFFAKNQSAIQEILKGGQAIFLLVISIVAEFGKAIATILSLSATLSIVRAAIEVTVGTLTVVNALFTAILSVVVRVAQAMDSAFGKPIKIIAEILILATVLRTIIVSSIAAKAAIVAILPAIEALAGRALVAAANFTTMRGALAASVAGLRSLALFLTTTPTGIALLGASLLVAAVAFGAFGDAAADAKEKADAIKLDTVKGQVEQAEGLRQQIEAVKGLTGEQGRLNEENARFQSILSSLPEAQQKVIAGLGTQKEKAAEAQKGLEKNLDTVRQLAQAQVGLLVPAIVARQQEIEKTNEQIRRLEEELRVRRELLNAGQKTQTTVIGAGFGEALVLTENLSSAEQDLNARRVESQKLLEETKKAQQENIAALLGNLNALGQTEEALLSQYKAGRLTTEEYGRLKTALDVSRASALNLLGGIDGVSASLVGAKSAAEQAQAALQAFFQTGDTSELRKRVTDRVNQIAAQSVQKGQTPKQALAELDAQIKANKDGIGDQIKALQGFDAAIKPLNERVSPSKGGGGRGGSRGGTTSDSGAGTLRDARIALEESRTAKLLAGEKSANETRQRFLDIALAGNLVSVRRYYDERAKLIRADAVLDIAEQEKKIQEQRKKAVEIADSLPGQLAGAKTPAQKATVENRAATEIAKAKKIVVDAEKEIEAINAKTAEAIANDTKAATQAQRELADAVFDVRKEMLELSGVGFTARIEEDTKRANEQINKLLVNGKFIAALQAAQNRDTRNNRTRAAGIGEEVDLQRQQSDLERLRIQNDVNLGVIGEGDARQRILAVEGELREAIAKRLEAQLLLSKGDEKAVIAIRRQIEELRTLATDERALREERAKGGFLNDKAFVDTARTQAKDARLSEQENTAKEIIRLQDQIATAGEGSADRIQLAYLKAFRSLQEENERAVEEVIAAQVKLQNNTNVDPARLNDGVIRLLATQKTLQESLQDFRTNQVQTVFDGIEKGVDKLTEKFGIVGKAVGQLGKDLAKLAASKLLEKILGISPTGTQSAAPQQQGGGFSLGRILNFGSGQQSGAGSFSNPLPPNAFGGGVAQNLSSPVTPGFAGGNPAQAILSGGRQSPLGNLLSKIPGIGRLFNTGTAVGASSAASGASGSLPIVGNLPIPGLRGPGVGESTASGLGVVSKAGGFLSKIPLIGKLFSSGASTGASAGAQSGVLGGLFSNPFSAAVGIGLIAAPFVAKLFGGLFGGGEFKKFRQQVQGLYQIKVDGKQEGKALYEAVKGLGEASFGKGSFGKRMSEVLQLKKAQEAIAAYGESTGQTESPLVQKLIKKREITDASAADNNFVRRATGGIVPGVDTGRDYVRALLRGGEFVTVPEVVQSQGRGRFDALNKGEARIMTNREIENLRRALQSVPFFSRGMRERILGQLNLRESVSTASFNRGYGNGGYVMPSVQAFNAGGYVFPQTSAQQASIETATSRAQASNAAQTVATGAQASQAASQREAALMSELRGNRVVMARLVEVIERLDGFDANTIVGMASPDAIASKTVEGFQSDSTLASRAQQGLGLRT